MPIVVGVTSAGNSVGNYSGLISRVIDHMDDTTLEDRVPSFVYYAEAMFNRELYPLNDETETTLTIAAGDSSVSLPSDFKKIRSLYTKRVVTETVAFTTVSDGGPLVLKQLSPDDFKERFLGSTAGRPEAFCINGGEILIGPEADEDYYYTIKYVRGLQNLSQSNQTNWLIENHPDVYFFGTLMYAELDGWNDERGTNFAQTTMEILERIKFWDAQRRLGNYHETVAGSYF